MKHGIVHLLQKYVLNLPIKLLFALGIAPPGYALLETIGRKTGKPRHTPVGDGRVAEQFCFAARRQPTRASALVVSSASQQRHELRSRTLFRDATPHGPD